MGRKEKKKLDMADGFSVGNLEELKEHFDIESVYEYFFDGNLLRWLNERYYEDEAEQVEQLNEDDPQLPKKLCAIFGVPFEEENNDPERQERLERLKQYTGDPAILNCVDQVAFDQEDLGYLLDDGIDEIYLCENRFNIPLRKRNKSYIGIGKAIAVLRSYKPVDFDALNIRFKNLTFEGNCIPSNRATTEIAIATDPKKIFEEGKAAFKTKDYKTALKKYKQAAELDFAPTFNEIGYMYYRGYGVEKDIEEAKRWCKRGMEKQDGNSFGGYAVLLDNEDATEAEKREAFQCMKRATELSHENGLWWKNLGNMHLFGTGTSKNLDEALRCYNRAAELGRSEVFSDIGSNYLFGIGVEEDIDEARHWYKRGMEKNDGESFGRYACSFNMYEATETKKREAFRCLQRATELDPQDGYWWYQLGEMYINGWGTSENLGEAFRCYEQGAKLNDSFATDTLGLMYLNGVYVKENVYKAAELFKKAVELYDENTSALINLAKCYRFGTGIAEDKRQAFNLYLKAAELGNLDAMETIGYMFYVGEGTDENEEKAFYWTKRAVDEGNNNAIENLAYHYRHGIGTAQDFSKAVELYTQAAELGKNNARVDLGEMFFSGEGVTKNLDKAIDYFSKAAGEGNSEAMNYLGVMYDRGEGFRKDSKKAVEFYRKAAETGNASGMSNLGLCYLWGDGVSEDTKTAEYWINKAVENGNCSGLLGYANWIYSQNPRDYRLIKMYETAANNGYGEAAYRLSVMFREGYGTQMDYSAARYWENKYKELGYEPDQRVIDAVNNPKSTKKSKGFFESLFS